MSAVSVLEDPVRGDLFLALQGISDPDLIFLCPVACFKRKGTGQVGISSRTEQVGPIPMHCCQPPPLTGRMGKGSGEGRIRATWGWISVDRGSKATLPLTMPRRVFKSSAKDSARRPWGIDIQGGRPRLVRRGG